MSQLRSDVAQQLHDGAAKLRAVSSDVPIIVWTATPDETLIYISDEWFAWSGKKRADRGTQAHLVHPNDRVRSVGAWHGTSLACAERRGRRNRRAAGGDLAGRRVHTSY